MTEWLKVMNLIGWMAQFVCICIVCRGVNLSLQDWNG